MVKSQYIFYIIGIIFVFITVAYFTHEYLSSISNAIKAIILFCLTIIFFFAADYLAERGI